MPDFGIKFYNVKLFYVVNAGNTVFLNISFPPLSITNWAMLIRICITIISHNFAVFYFFLFSLVFFLSFLFLRSTAEKRTYELVTFKFNVRTIYIYEWLCLWYIYFLCGVTLRYINSIFNVITVTSPTY